MKYSAFRKKELKHFSGALALERIFPSNYRRFLNFFLNIFLFLIFALTAFYFIEGYTKITFGEDVAGFLNKVGAYGEQIVGVLVLILLLKIKLFALNSFFNSYYLRGAESALQEYKKEGDGPYALFEVAYILKKTKPGDLTGGFLKSFYGGLVLERCGIDYEKVNKFLKGSRIKLKASDVDSEFEGFIGLSEYTEMLYDNDKDLKQFLLQNKIQRKDFKGAASFVDLASSKFKEKKRWWSNKHLQKIEGIAKDWSFGKIFLLKKYGSAIEEMGIYNNLEYRSFYGSEEAKKMENVLSREIGANLMFVGEYKNSMLEILARLSMKIKKGKTSNYLKEKKFFIIDANALVSQKESAADFEAKFISVLNQALKAGNMILVFENFTSLLKGTEKLGTDVVSILKKYLNSKDLHIVALLNSDEYHKKIEGNSKLMIDFETLYFNLDDSSAILKILEDKALLIEYRHGVLFTYPALRVISESAERYFSSGVLADKALDILFESASFVKNSGRRMIKKEDISNIVESKTGIPLGKMDKEEKEKLLNLEKKMHKWIIGQDEAVSKIAEAMRRARAGVGSADKPMGTFLFLGPTGVGKTHTAKTLAKVFFGRESKMMRLDMSEYTGSNALRRLIGSFANPSGTLTSLIREKQYGVLLLDEFEKTNPDVHDLFLQIFDEGVFSDYNGKKVNARNLIMIATSNAGSKLIWKMFEEGKNVSESKDELLDNIIRKGIFKTELINRFDGVIVFHPLQKEHLREIAKILLKEFNKRISKKGIKLEINDEVVSYLVEEGYDPQFGARPMRRVIQEKIEHTIAEKMLRDEITPGSKISLKRSDLS